MMGLSKGTLLPLGFANKAVAEEMPVLLLAQGDNGEPAESSSGDRSAGAPRPRRASAALQYSRSFEAARGRSRALLRCFYVFRFPALFTIRHVERIILICLLVALIIFIASWSNT
jgi:hypothetical protein